MSVSNLTLLGLNHRSAPLDLRERLAFTDDQLPLALAALSELFDEAFLLSTCNRTELYVVTDRPEASASLAEFLAAHQRLSVGLLDGHAYSMEGQNAVRHLFRVSSGLDSMVLGESQVLGQVRDAFEAAVAAGTVGRQLGRALPLAIETGKRARSETAIGRGAVSPSSVAVAVARRTIGDLAARTVLVIGAGEAGQATAQSLLHTGVGEILVTNRSLGRAQELAAEVSGQAIPYEELISGLAAADIVISSTGASEQIVSIAEVREAVQRRPERPLLCIDIAVPRDIDPQVAELPSVLLYNVDDLDAESAANLEDRAREVSAVGAIVEEAVAEYERWKATQPLLPTIGALYERAEAIRRAEVERTMGRLKSLTDEERVSIDAMTSSIVRRLLHGTVSALRNPQADGESERLAAAVQQLFDLAPQELGPPGRAP